MLAYLNILFLKLGKIEPVTSIAWVTNLVHTKVPWVFTVAMNSKIKKNCYYLQTYYYYYYYYYYYHHHLLRPI